MIVVETGHSSLQCLVKDFMLVIINLWEYFILQYMIGILFINI